MPNPLIKAVTALLNSVPPIPPDHHDRDAQCARNGRWGTCSGCPRDEQGHVLPERCAYTTRYDHNIIPPMLEPVPVQRKLLEDLRAALTTHVEHLEGMVAHRDLTIEHLNMDFDALREQLETAKANAASLDRGLRCAQEEIARLKALATESDPTRATELEWLKWFACNADFGPGDGDQQDHLKKYFMRETGKNLPLGWNLASDGETSLDK